MNANKRWKESLAGKWMADFLFVLLPPLFFGCNLSIVECTLFQAFLSDIKDYKGSLKYVILLCKISHIYILYIKQIKQGSDVISKYQAKEIQSFGGWSYLGKHIPSSMHKHSPSLLNF